MQAALPDVSNDSIVDNVADALIAVTLAGQIIFWNRGAERMFGFARDEALGCLITELIIPPELHVDCTRWSAPPCSTTRCASPSTPT
jgi:PAS domain-containing protein